MSESKRKIFFAILAVLLLLSGCIILLYPSLNGLWVDYTMRRNAEAFYHKGCLNRKHLMW